MTKTLDMNAIENVLFLDKKYYHCRQDGIIYADEGRTIPVVDLIYLTGHPQIPRELNEYSIDSSYCLKCEVEVFM